MSLAKAQELRDKKGRAFEQAQSIAARAEEEGRDLTPDEESQIDDYLDDVDKYGKRAEEIEAREDRLAAAQEELEKKQERIDGNREFGDVKRDAEELQRETRQKFGSFLQALGTRDEKRIAEAKHEYSEAFEVEARATGQQTVGTAGEGGTWVPTDFANEVLAQMKAFGGMRRSRARVINTDHGRNLDMPTYDDVSNVAQIVSEASTFKSTHVAVSKFTLEAEKYGTGPIKLSSEILQDSVPNIEAVVREALATRMGRGTERHFAVRSSTESAGPHGLINASTGNLTIAKGSSNLTPEKLMDLIHTVDPAYRVNGEWMFADEVLQAIRKLRVGSSDDFLWEPSFTRGVPDRILGYPYIINQSLNDGTGSTADVNQTIANAGTKPVWFGDFQSYYIRDVNGLQLRTLTERYAPQDMIAILGFQRVDGRPAFATTTASLKPLHCILTT